MEEFRMDVTSQEGRVPLVDADYQNMPEYQAPRRQSAAGGATRNTRGSAAVGGMVRKSNAAEYMAQKTAAAGERRTSAAIQRNTQAALDAAPVNRITARQEIAPTDRQSMARRTTQGGDDMTGLTTAQFEALLAEHGPNEVAEKEVSITGMFFKQFTGVMPVCMAVCVVICAIAVDLIDLILIMALLATNGVVGFREEYHAYCELQALIDSDIKTCRVKRDGRIYTQTVDTPEGPKEIGLEIKLLVPGDIVSIKIGDVIPADCMVLEGDVKMDTKAVTGEPVPWKVPRPTPEEAGKYAKDEKGKELWAGCPIVQGECHAVVIRTGAKTITGEINQALAEKSVARKSDFELKILLVVKSIIIVAFVIGVVMFLVVLLKFQLPYEFALKAWVAILMGSIPIALPLVLLVVMASGTVTMAGEKALVSDQAALADIASMTCLNSDKTGTLTTAVMDIDFHRIHAEEGFTQLEVLEFGVVASNRANADDAIDGAIVRKWDEQNGGTEKGEAAISNKWKVNSNKGFNNASKRTECQVTKNGSQKIMIIKGLPPKLLKNDETPSAEDEDNSHTRYQCKNYAQIKDRILQQIIDFEDAGLKTIGVAVQQDGGEVAYAGILPMVDPPRRDAAMCVKMIREAGVEVKMVTGDAVNIAKTTAGDIGIGTNILPNSAFTDHSGAALHQLVLESNGFAQVMPKDKETVVLEEKQEGWIVGFCGDGANDALALNVAHVGIAVADAMEAAIKASAIQLLDPGLQCIFTAIVESRKIFRRIKAYVVFRVAATIQMIAVLSVLTFASGCNIDLIYVILLALFNDLSLIMIGSDNQKASKLPDRPNVYKILAQACTFGTFQLLMSLIFFYVFNDPSANILEAVDDSFHINPVTWYNYANSQGGIGDNKDKYPQNGISDKVNSYQVCMQTICPTYQCKTKKMMMTGDYITEGDVCGNDPLTTSGSGTSLTYTSSGSARCTDPQVFTTGSSCYDCFTTGNNCGQCTWMQSAGYTTTINQAGYVDKVNIHKTGGFCPTRKGTYDQKLNYPQWQECCVEYASLQHPGVPYPGSHEDACTEITTINMFIQILVASEFMIFPVRALGWIWTSSKPANAVMFPVFGTVAVLSILAAIGYPENAGPLGPIFVQASGWTNWIITIAWSLLATLLLDVIKFSWVTVIDGSTEEIEYERVAHRMEAEGLAIP